MKSALQLNAEIILNVEYPGRDLLAALIESNEHSLDALETMRTLEAEINQINYTLDQVTQDYHRAVGNANLFRVALEEEASEMGGK